MVFGARQYFMTPASPPGISSVRCALLAVGDRGCRLPRRAAAWVSRCRGRQRGLCPAFRYRSAAEIELDPSTTSRCPSWIVI